MSPAADKGLLNYTTKVPVDRTVNEMQTMLGQSGARRVAVEWENGIPSALSFTLDGPHGERLYTLPVDATGTNSRPEVFLTELGGYLDTRKLSTPQLQRAWCLSLTRLLWPTIDPVTALTVASWLYQNRTDPPDDA